MRRLALLAGALLALTACMHDGRTLRPETNRGTLSILPPSTVPEDAGDTLPGEDLGDDTGGFVEDQAPGLTVTAPWEQDAVIPAKYTCDGEEISPSVSWEGVPEGTVEIAIELYDLQVPSYVHWIVAGIDPALGGIDEGQIPAGAVQATNTEGEVKYAGPCPPVGETHTYELQVNALDHHLNLTDGTDGPTMRQQIGAATLASSFVSGTVTG